MAAQGHLHDSELQESLFELSPMTPYTPGQSGVLLPSSQSRRRIAFAASPPHRSEDRRLRQPEEEEMIGVGEQQEGTRRPSRQRREQQHGDEEEYRMQGKRYGSIRRESVLSDAREFGGEEDSRLAGYSASVRGSRAFASLGSAGLTASTQWEDLLRRESQSVERHQQHYKRSRDAWSGPAGQLSADALRPRPVEVPVVLTVVVVVVFRGVR